MDLGLDRWKYFGITHTDHTIMNPLSLEKTRELVGLLRLPEGGRVLDVACGKAEFLCLVAEAYNVKATGIDLSPYTIKAARQNVETRGLAGRIELLHADGGKYQPDAPESLDLASCIGASWVYENHAGTLNALSRMTRPGAVQNVARTQKGAVTAFTLRVKFSFSEERRSLDRVYTNLYYKSIYVLEGEAVDNWSTCEAGLRIPCSLLTTGGFGIFCEEFHNVLRRT
jgi:ubiquinone/menaquinone biosynthesis C-methylase UbiE